MLAKIKSYFENIEITPTSWLVGISGVCFVRFFLESITNPSSTGFFASDASTLVHYYVFFLTSAFGLMVILRLFVPSWSKVIPQIVAFSFLAIIISPIVDFIVSKGQGSKMIYMLDKPKEMLFSFLCFFGKHINNGATVGLVIEIALAIIILGFFVYSVSKNLKRSLLSALSLYVFTFVMTSLPGFISLIFQGFHQNLEPIKFFENTALTSLTAGNGLHSSLLYSSAGRFFELAFNFMMGKFFFLIFIVLAMVWSFLNFKEKFFAFVKNSRPSRIFHFILMIFLGFIYSRTLFPNFGLNWNDWLSLLMLCLSLFFSGMFAICINDIADEKIDSISNIDRPLIRKTLNIEDMKQMSVFFLLASLISGFLSGYLGLFFILAFTALYYVYSASPTRFKIIPFFSSFIIGLCSLTMVLAGFFTFSPIKLVHFFPAKIMAGIVIVFSLFSIVRDIKDIEGDKKAGVPTVPVIFGDKYGPIIVAALASLAFLLAPIFIGVPVLFIFAVPAALLSYFYATKKPYSEKKWIAVYFAFWIVSFSFLYFAG